MSTLLGEADMFGVDARTSVRSGPGDVVGIAVVAAAALATIAAVLLHVLSPLDGAVRAVGRGELPTFEEEILVTPPPRAPAPTS